MTRLRLPRFQYTVREVVSGLTFVGYAMNCQELHHPAGRTRQRPSRLARGGPASRRLADRQRQRVSSRPRPPRAARRRAGVGQRPPLHPTKAYTWQSDVETVHRLVEDEFFDRECFRSPTEFWAKATTTGITSTSPDSIAARNGRRPCRSSVAVAGTSTPPSPVGAVLTSAHFIANTSFVTKKGHDLPVDP